MNGAFVAENARELDRLRAIVARLSDEELKMPLGSNWTISVAFAHLAFWDQRSLVLVRKWKSTGVEASPIDVDVANDSLLPTWLALDPKSAARLAVSAAEAIDKELAESSPDFISKVENMGSDFRLFRSIHRKLHLDQIEESLQNK
jgi:hypothetical protein